MNRSNHLVFCLYISGIILMGYGLWAMGYGLGCMYWPLAPIWFGLWSIAIGVQVAKQRALLESTKRTPSNDVLKREQAGDEPRVN